MEDRAIQAPVSRDGSQKIRLNTSNQYKYFNITWSPDGSSYLYTATDAIYRQEGGVSEPTRITPDGIYAVMPKWAPDGADGTVFNPATGGVVGIAVDEPGERAVSPGTWSMPGGGVADRVAFWTEKCVGESVLGGCSLERRIVYVGNAQMGGATALAMEEARDGSSALLFSTDGRWLYYSVGGKLYRAGV